MRYQHWLSLRLSLLSCYRGEVQGRRQQVVDRPYLSAWRVTRGRCEVQPARGGRAVAAAEGQWILPVAGPRRHTFSDDFAVLSLNFFAHWADGRRLYDPPETVVFDASRFPALERRATAINRVIERWLPGHNFYMFDEPIPFRGFAEVHRLFPGWVAVLADVLAELGVPLIEQAGGDPRVSAAMARIEQHPFGQPFDREALAAQVGASAAHLDRLFVKEIGETPHRVFDRRRIAHARRCLEVSPMPIKQVAFELGFADLSRFSRWFRRAAGLSPQSYRARAVATPGPARPARPPGPEHAAGPASP